MASSRNRLVLVVEDDYEIRETISDLLRDEGYAVATAENGVVALQYLRAATDLPAVILLDISMPIMDGYGFRAEQVKDPRIAGIPTAMISADGQVNDKAKRAGVSEFLKKPVELEDLLVLVNKHCPKP
jgi:CheY-like chemotaxis protein